MDTSFEMIADSYPESILDSMIGADVMSAQVNDSL